MSLGILEKIIIAKRSLFKKATVMPKGESPLLNGAICKFLENAVDVCNTLTRASGSNGFIFVKLKRKLECKGYVYYFESVIPDFIFSLSQFLKINNHLYHDIDLNISNIMANLGFKSSTFSFFE